MSVNINTYIVCDYCDAFSEGVNDPKRSLAQVAREAAENAGWIRTRHRGVTVDLCPACAGARIYFNTNRWCPDSPTRIHSASWHNGFTCDYCDEVGNPSDKKIRRLKSVK